MPGAGEDLRYVLTVDPDVQRVNAALSQMASEMDKTGKRMGDAMIRGMSAAGGGAVGPSGANMSPMVALMSVSGRDQALSTAVEEAGRRLRLLNAYRESQERKQAAEARSAAMSQFGRAAAGAAIGELGGLGGIGAMIAGGVTPAAGITAALEIPRKAAEGFAAAASAAARSLNAFNSEIGPFAVGMTRSMGNYQVASALGVPFAGAMAQSKAADLEMEETRFRMLRLAQPGMMHQLDFAQQGMRAAIGQGEAWRVPGQIVASNLQNSIAQALGEAESRARVATMERDARLGWFWGGNLRSADSRSKSRVAGFLQGGIEEQEFLEEARKRAEGPRGLTPAEERDIRDQYKKRFGRDMQGPMTAAMPAQMMGVEEYLSQAYTSAASIPPPKLGAGENDHSAWGMLGQAIRDLTEQLRLATEANPQGEAVDQMAARARDASGIFGGLFGRLLGGGN